MIISNIQLNPNEDESLHQTGHCGGTCFSRYAKEILNRPGDEFYIYGRTSNFRNLRGNENVDKCIHLNESDLDRIKRGEPVVNIIPESVNWDIIIHNQESWAANTTGLKAKQVCWFTFVNQTFHPKNDALFLYSEKQNPRILAPTRVYQIRIGKKLFNDRVVKTGRSGVFVCTRHDASMDTNVIINICNRNGIRIDVAGPVLGDYKLNVDNKSSFYLGEIGENDKINLTSKCRLYSCIQNWDTIFSLSAIEALGCGVPIVAYNRGCFSDLIQNNINGFFFDGSDYSFLRSYYESNFIDSGVCVKSAELHSEHSMVESFYQQFRRVLSE